MAPLTFILPLLSLVLSASAVPSPVCSQFPYDLILPLSRLPAAESFCSAKFPLAPVPPP